MSVIVSAGEPQGKDGNQKIRDKCKQYLDRAEELKEYLANKEVVANVCINIHIRVVRVQERS